MKKPKKPSAKKLAIKKPVLKKPAMPRVVKRTFKRQQAAEERLAEALSNAPRITNETVAEHREEVLGGARKYIYPLRHSKHRVVRISIALLSAVIVAFFAFCGLELYKFQSTSGFMYGVTSVIPFPVAKAGSSWVSYESYLFELRRNIHYYQTQQQANFSTKDGKIQLAQLKKQAMQTVIRDAYVKQLASKNHVSVSSREVNNMVTLVKSQDRLGSSDRVLRDVLNQFWGWDINDFKRELRQELLQQAVVAKLDVATNERANAVLQQLASGADFGALATQNSDDASTKATGGQYASTVVQNDPDLSPKVTSELFKLTPGQVSGVINAGYSLEILRLIDGDKKTGGHAAHIQFNFQPITTYTDPLEKAHKPRHFISI